MNRSVPPKLARRPEALPAHPAAVDPRARATVRPQLVPLVVRLVARLALVPLASALANFRVFHEQRLAVKRLAAVRAFVQFPDGRSYGFLAGNPTERIELRRTIVWKKRRPRTRQRVDVYGNVRRFDFEKRYGLADLGARRSFGVVVFSFDPHGSVDIGFWNERTFSKT